MIGILLLILIFLSSLLLACYFELREKDRIIEQIKLADSLLLSQIKYQTCVFNNCPMTVKPDSCCDCVLYRANKN